MPTTNLEKHTTGNPIGRFFLNNFMAVLIAEVKNLKPKTILDVGAGEGFTLQKLKDNHVGEVLEGIEYIGEAIALGKKLHPTIKIKKGDIYDLKYKDNAFDLVICTEVLEHLEDPERAVRELMRVTNKYVLLSVPNEPLFTVQRICRGKNLKHMGAHPEHIQHWGTNAFKAMVSKYMQVIVHKTPIPWTLIVGKKLR